jgi:LmbE family N-acetylglucosaminyl deacetylase
MMQIDEEATPAAFAGGWLRAHLSACPAVIPLVSLQSDATYIGRVAMEPFTRSQLVCAAACDGLITFEQLIERLPEEHQEIVNLLDYLVWWDRPIADATPQADETWLVVSPHPDDAELSIGGLILNHRERVRFAQAICFSRLIRTRFPESFPTAWEASAIRKDEAALAALMAGLTNHFLDFPEAFLRQGDESTGQQPVDELELRALLKLALYNVIAQEKPTRILAPAAIGNHPDHRMVFDIMLDLIEENRFPDSTISFYEDAPYCASHLAIDDFLARFENSYFKPRPHFEDISVTLPGKLMLSEIYRSQFSRSIQPVLEGIARRNASLAPMATSTGKELLGAERLWTLEERSFAHTLAI